MTTPYSNTELPVYPVSLYGYRTYRLGYFEGQYFLRSIVYNASPAMILNYRNLGLKPQTGVEFVQEPAVNYTTGLTAPARCITEFQSSLANRHAPGIAPVKECHCGHWAVFDPFFVPNSINLNSSQARGIPVVVFVEARGKVVLGTKGFRAATLKVLGFINDTRIYNAEILHWRYTSTPRQIILNTSGLDRLPEFSAIDVHRIRQAINLDDPDSVMEITDLGTHLREFPVMKEEDF